MSALSSGLGTVLLQQQTLAPQQQYALRLLRMSAQELLAEADLAAEENPLLERDAAAEASPAEQAAVLHEEVEAVTREGEPLEDAADRGPLENTYAGWPRSGDGEDETPVVERVAAPVSLRSDLLAELGTLTLDEKTRELVACLIEELDDAGFLPAPVEEVAPELSDIIQAPSEAWQKALEILQSLDPPGIGAVSPTESLILQARRRQTEGEATEETVELLTRLVRECLPQLAARNRKALLKVANGDAAVLDRALALLGTLSPHPASRYADVNAQYVIADIVVTRRNGSWTADLNTGAQPALKISSLARNMAVDEATPFGRYLSEARRLIAGIEARQSTLLRTARFAVARQQAFFEKGSAALQPLTIGEAAAALGLSDSTVSRTVSGKYLQCPLGTFELRRLFLLPSVQSIDAAGTCAAMSPAGIRARIRAIVAEEPAAAPFSDQVITERLQNEGVSITRRTVAKYRDLEGIPVARLRAH